MNVVDRVVRRAFLLGLRRQLVGDADHRHEQVDVDAEQALGRLAGHRVGDGGPHVAALGDVAGVAEAAHQLRPGAPTRPESQPSSLGSPEKP